MSDPTNATESPIVRPGRGASRWGLGLTALVAAMAAGGWFWQNSRNSAAPYWAPARESKFMPKITKTDAQWRAQLTAEQYEVTRRKGTERPFTGAYWNHKEPGRYKCIACGAELFTSETKYDSACGWPSFFASDHEENLHVEPDNSYGMIRTEVMCKNCGAHLGHVFDDGPQPTGVRYCINSAALDFEGRDAADSGPDESE